VLRALPAALNGKRSRLLQAFFPEQKALITPPTLDSLPPDGRHNAHELWLFVAKWQQNAIAFAGLGIEVNALQNGVGIGIALI
jgi:hypothetical protein